MQFSVEKIADIIARDIGKVDSIFREKDAIREEVIKLTREIIRLSSNVINDVHQERREEARLNLARVQGFVEKLLSLVDNHPDLKYSGLTYNGLSEYIEAFFFYSIVTNSSVPTFDELKIPIVPYLQGLGDLIGELRRLIIRLLNELKISEAERYFNVMEAIYNSLRTLDYPEPLMPGVKHKVDVASRLIEDTRVLILSTKNSMRCVEISKV